MEYLDIYDERRVPTGRTAPRGTKLCEGEYYLVVHMLIFRKDGKFLIQRRVPEKHSWPDMWDISLGGMAQAGDSSASAAEHMTPAATWGVQIGEMKEWETDILRDYIHGIRTCYYFDTKAYTVLLEEAEKMLAGDQTPEETAKMMQSRVSLYLSEQS